ncbi:MAG: DMT family transporter [Chromatiales bacterium]
MQAWLYMVASIILEVAGTTSMKLSEGLTRLLPTIAMFVFYALSFACFALAVRRIELGTAYAVWSGLGTALITVVGIVWFKDSAGAVKVASIALIVIGVIGLNVSGSHP